MAARVNLPAIVIVGPTASGKTALAVELAQLHGGEIICADSRTIYRDMDIGTAKPSVEERGGIAHWGIDLVTPGERHTAADFQVYANTKMSEIRARDKVPIIVGGTGLYIDGLVFDYEYPPEPEPQIRQQLDGMDVETLQKYCIDNNIEMPINAKNKRHLIQAALRKNSPGKRSDRIRADVLMYGIAVNKTALRTRIMMRAEQIFTDGVVEEARMLGEKYGWESEAMTGNIYPLLREYIAGNADLVSAQDAFARRDWQLAKRQMTWFRRNPYIAWGVTCDIKSRVNDVLASGYNL